MGEVEKTIDGTPIRIAVDQDGSHHVLVPVDRTSPNFRIDGHSLQVRVKTVALERLQYQSVLDIYCVNKSLNSTFDRLAAEIIEIAKYSSSPVVDSIDRLTEWRDLFLDQRRRSISPQQRIGLFAELTVLLEFVLSEEVSDTRCWTGPAREPHDFEFETMSLEIKGYGAGTDLITFHGALQLDSVENKPLFLCIREITEDPNGQSLIEVVDQIEGLVKDPHHFRSTANKIGILADDSSLAEYRYKVVRETLIEVTESTPRIVASSFVDGVIPEGIESLRYSVSPEDLIAEGAHADFETWLEQTWR